MFWIKFCCSDSQICCDVLEVFNNVWAFLVSRSVNLWENFLAPVKFEASKSRDDRSQREAAGFSHQNQRQQAEDSHSSREGKQCPQTHARKFGKKAAGRSSQSPSYSRNSSGDRKVSRGLLDQRYLPLNIVSTQPDRPYSRSARKRSSGRH